jgi:hypothetical protein
MTIPKHPTELPDEVIFQMTEVARKFGYRVNAITLEWDTDGLGIPAQQQLTYEVEKIDTSTLSASSTGRTTRW